MSARPRCLQLSSLDVLGVAQRLLERTRDTIQ